MAHIPSLSQPRFSIVVEHNLAAKMRDGITRYADVHRPDGLGKFPVILLRVPSDKTAATPLNYVNYFTPRGYAVVVQDTRGRYTSEGEYYPLIHERELGAEVSVDDAGPKVGGNTGNVLARVKGTAPGAPPLLLSAHMDTVAPGKGVKPIVAGDIIRTDGTTVLGGDDKSGVAIICEVIRALKEHHIPHGDLELVFTICEEVGLLGAQHVDTSKLQARHGLVLDSDAAGFLFTKAPASDRLEFRVYGLEAHAGVCPERGISAIQIAGEAIAAMRLGRIDAETTANLGMIEGGTATNVVPNAVVIKGEARSHSEAKLEAQVAHMRQCFREAAARHRVELGGEVSTGRVEEDISRSYDRMDIPDDAHIVQLVFQAANNLGEQVKTLPTGGGCDANVFNRTGIEVANLGTGMRDIHTVREWLDVHDMIRAATIVLEIVRLNAQMS